MELNPIRDSFINWSSLSTTCQKSLGDTLSTLAIVSIPPSAIPPLITQTVLYLTVALISSTVVEQLTRFKEARAYAQIGMRNLADVNNTPLLRAIEQGSVNMATRLVNNGAHVNVVNNDKTPLTLALDRDYKQLSLALIEKGASVDPILRSCDELISKRENLPKVERILMTLLEANIDLSNLTQTHHRFMADIHLKYLSSKYPIIDKHIKEGEVYNKVNFLYGVHRAELREADSIEGETSALHLAISSQNIELARDLIKLGANVNDRDRQGFTPALRAGFKPQTEMLNLLAENGADLRLEMNTPHGTLAFRLNNQRVTERYNRVTGEIIPIVKVH